MIVEVGVAMGGEGVGNGGFMMVELGIAVIVVC